MASKRLGRLRQWAGEMVSSKDKSEVTEEARELERDIETRSDGLRRLHSVGTMYHRSISKKKASDAVDDEGKMLPRDALGIVMIVHGEQLEGSLYGSSLVKLGQAHCKVALAQEALALTLQSSYLESLEASAEEIREYEAERKALETRRINYDAAVTALEKVQANKKAKDKERDQAEDEVVKAKLKYDEQAEDLRARIEAIQDREVEQLRDLTGMLDAELAFAEQYAEILRDVKRDWASHSSMNRRPSRREVGPMHNFAKMPDLNGSTNGSPELPSRSRSASAPTRKRTASSATAKGQPTSASAVDSDTDESEEEHAPVMSRRSSKAAKPTSRPQSRSGARSRANSAATAKGDKTDDEEKGKHSRRPSMGNKSVEEKDAKSGKRMSVAGWLPSIGRKKGQNIDRDLFANLDEDDSDAEGQPPVSSAVSARSFGSMRSKKSAGASSPVIPPRPHRDTEAKQPKLVRAIHDFAGSSDELSFQSGDVIAVVSEVLDGWWMGELDGHRGLFPTTHTEEFRPTTPRLRPNLPPRAGTFGGQLSPGHPIPERSHSDEAAAHPFGDEHATTNSLFSPLSATFSGDESAADTHSIADSMDDGAFLMPKKAHDEREDAFGPPGEGVRQPPPPPPRRTTTPKVPPPPPPRRAHSNAPSLDSNNAHMLHHSPSAGSSLRRPPSSGSSLTGHSSSFYQSASAASSASGHSGTSPVTTKGSPFGLRDSETGACTAFEQQPMRAAGMCANCQRMHLDV